MISSLPAPLPLQGYRVMILTSLNLSGSSYLFVPSSLVLRLRGKISLEVVEL